MKTIFVFTQDRKTIPKEKSDLYVTIRKPVCKNY